MALGCFQELLCLGEIQGWFFSPLYLTISESVPFPRKAPCVQSLGKTRSGLPSTSPAPRARTLVWAYTHVQLTRSLRGVPVGWSASHGHVNAIFWRRSRSTLTTGVSLAPLGWSSPGAPWRSTGFRGRGILSEGLEMVLKCSPLLPGAGVRNDSQLVQTEQENIQDCAVSAHRSSGHLVLQRCAAGAGGQTSSKQLLSEVRSPRDCTYLRSETCQELALPDQNSHPAGAASTAWQRGQGTRTAAGQRRQQAMPLRECSLVLSTLRV